MTIDDQKLVEQCEAGIKTLAGVDEWVRANPQAAGSSGEALLRESNRLARALRKEAATAARKMCVGVFGPSQSGKSYLISALAQDAAGSLLAALGGEITVPSLDGESRITLPEGTQTGQVFRLRGKGIKNLRSGAKGDLFCRVYVETPVNLSAEQKKILKSFDTSIAKNESKHSPKHQGFLDRVKKFFSD